MDRKGWRTHRLDSRIFKQWLAQPPVLLVDLSPGLLRVLRTGPLDSKTDELDPIDGRKRGAE